MSAQPIALVRDHTPQGVNTPTKVVTAQTVQKMAEHIRQAQTDPAVWDLTRRLMARCSSVDQFLAACWTWAKHHIRFTHDDDLIRQLLNESDHFELLISPPVLLRMAQPKGDCDDFTMLLGALCMCASVPFRIVTLACDRRRPGEYSHVSGSAQLPNGEWCPLDASHGSRLGWEVPGFDIQRRTEWDMNGEEVFDRVYSQQEQNAKRKQYGLGAWSDLPVIDTGLPVVGTINLQNPMEWLFWGGAAASLVFLKEGPQKIAGAAGFLGARFVLGLMGVNV